jgi:hypothetical protein
VKELGIFLFTTASRTALGPTQPPIQCVPGALSLGVKRSLREADHSPPSSAEVKECVELYLHSPNTPSWRGAQLKHRDNFTSKLSLCLTKHHTMKAYSGLHILTFLFLLDSICWNISLWGGNFSCKYNNICILYKRLIILMADKVIFRHPFTLPILHVQQITSP